MYNDVTETLRLALHFMRHGKDCPRTASKAGSCTCGFEEAEGRVRRKIEKCEAYDASRSEKEQAQ